jgi:DNA-binding MarR family transcriptional regulator
MPEPPDDSPGEDVRDDLGEAFWAVARQLRQLHRAALAPWEITPSQQRALGTLFRHGNIRLSGLAEHLRIAARSATEVVDGLEERGFVERRPDPHDRRATLVALTGRGAELADTIRASRDATSEGLFNRLSADDRAALSRILRVLRA